MYKNISYTIDVLKTIAGFTIIVYALGWLPALGILLIMWSNNGMQKLIRSVAIKDAEIKHLVRHH